MARFTDVFVDVTKEGQKIPKENYLSHGTYPIIDQGQEYIAGYSDDSVGLYENVPAIIFGDHTRIIKYVDTPCFLGADGVKLLKAKASDSNYKYLYYALSYAQIPNTGYNRHFKWLKEVDIRLPDLNEQQRIVKILDKLGNLISLRKQQLAKLDELVKARFVEMFGDPIFNPHNYPIHRLGDLSVKISDGVHAKPEYVESGRPFLSVVNINKRKVDFANCKYVSEEAYQKMIKSTYPQKGDVLYTKVGATYGIPAYIDTDIEFCLYVSVCLIKPNHDLINSKFLAVSMDMPYIKMQADSRIKGIGVPDLHLNQISEFNILCPPREVQNFFVHYVESVEEEKLTIQQSLDKLEMLKKSLMQEYFG